MKQGERRQRQADIIQGQLDIQEDKNKTKGERKNESSISVIH